MSIQKGQQCIESPVMTLLPSLSEQERLQLAYPPDAMPGARDIQTLYGSTRVYEFGPVTGRKVLFVHGDATPCLIFAHIAQALAERGCRVMLFGKLT